MEDIMKIVKSFKGSGLLKKAITRTIENETKKQKEVFLGLLLGTLDASLSGNILLGKSGVVRVGDEVVQTGDGEFRNGQDI